MCTRAQASAAHLVFVANSCGCFLLFYPRFCLGELLLFLEGPRLGPLGLGVFFWEGRFLSKVTTAENDLSRAPLRPAEGAATSGKPSQNG